MMDWNGTKAFQLVRRLLPMVMMTSGFAIGFAQTSNSQTNKLSRFTFTEYHMGNDTRIVVYAPDQKTAEEACSDAFNRVADLDSMMSDYRTNSELTHLCEQSGGAPMKISPEFFFVLQRAQEVSKLTDGLFDVTVSPVVRLWRKARKTGKLPDPVALDAARKLVGYRNLVLDEKAVTARLTKKGMQIDLGAIAKGYADDEAQKVLKRHGITSALIEMGGDIVVTDAPPGEKGWKILVPNAEEGQGPAEMELSNCAISSSGDTEQFVLIGGEKYSHVINPKTGVALHQGVQATVIAKDGITSDSLSTAVTLVSKKGRARISKAYPGVKQYVRILPINTRASG